MERLERSRDGLFKTVVRMNRESYDVLLELVIDADVFKNKSTKQQEEPGSQLAATLYRLGHNGSSAGSGIAEWSWDRSEGACQRYIQRGSSAIMLLQDQYLKWPTLEERQTHLREWRRKGFQVAVGLSMGLPSRSLSGQSIRMIIIMTVMAVIYSTSMSYAI
ncbi:unnamed protein product [Mortierella alpina]